MKLLSNLVKFHGGLNGYNLSLEFSPVQCGQKLIVDNKDISVEEYSNFDFFKKQIEEQDIFKELLNSGDVKNISDRKEITQLANKANSALASLKKETIKLSYRYANLALLSHENKNRHATTRYFKRAIELDKIHAQAFLLEKNNREGNKKAEIEIEDKSPHDKVNRLNFLLKNDNLEKEEYRKILQEIIFTITSNEKDFNNIMQDYVNKLVVSYQKDNTIREHYKYLYLGNIFNYLPKSHDYSNYFYFIWVHSANLAQLFLLTEA